MRSNMKGSQLWVGPRIGHSSATGPDWYQPTLLFQPYELSPMILEESVVVVGVGGGCTIQHMSSPKGRNTSTSPWVSGARTYCLQQSTLCMWKNSSWCVIIRSWWRAHTAWDPRYLYPVLPITNWVLDTQCHQAGLPSSSPSKTSWNVWCWSWTIHEGRSKLMSRQPKSMLPESNLEPVPLACIAVIWGGGGRSQLKD